MFARSSSMSNSAFIDRYIRFFQDWLSNPSWASICLKLIMYWSLEAFQWQIRDQCISNQLFQYDEGFFIVFGSFFICTSFTALLHFCAFVYFIFWSGDSVLSFWLLGHRGDFSWLRIPLRESSCVFFIPFCKSFVFVLCCLIACQKSYVLAYYKGFSDHKDWQIGFVSQVTFAEDTQNCALDIQKTPVWLGLCVTDLSPSQMHMQDYWVVTIHSWNMVWSYKETNRGQHWSNSHRVDPSFFFSLFIFFPSGEWWLVAYLVIIMKMYDQQFEKLLLFLDLISYYFIFIKYNFM